MKDEVRGDEGIAPYKDEMTDGEYSATARRGAAKSNPYKSGRTQFAPTPIPHLHNVTTTTALGGSRK